MVKFKKNNKKKNIISWSQGRLWNKPEQMYGSHISIFRSNKLVGVSTPMY